jgi:hypothetical protein
VKARISSMGNMKCLQNLDEMPEEGISVRKHIYVVEYRII